MPMLDLCRAFPKRAAKRAFERTVALVAAQVQLSLSEISQVMIGHR